MRTLPLLLGATTLLGCPHAGLPDLPKPGLTVEDVFVGEVSFDGIALTFGLRIDNPYPVRLDMRRIDWTLDLAGAQLLRGRGPGATLPARGDVRLDLPIELRWSELVPALRAMGGADELPWTLNGIATFDTPAGPVELPFGRSGRVPVLHPPRVSLRELRLVALDRAARHATIDLVVDLATPQRHRVQAIDYALTVGGAASQGRAAIDRYDPDGHVVATRLSLEDLGDVTLDALSIHAAVRARLEGIAHLETAHGVVTLPLDLDDLVEVADRTAM